MNSSMETLKDWYTGLTTETRRLIVFMAAILLLLLMGYVLIQGRLGQLDKVKNSREQTLKELLLLRQRYRDAASDAQRLTNRIASVTAEDSPASIVEQSGSSARASIQSKPLPRQEQGSLIEDGAELTLTGLSLNEVVNLLHRLEQGTKPVVIKKIAIRSRFSEPARLDLTLQMALFRPAPLGKR